jgi:DNA-binding MarR family transcriptional regulator/GNAT superfamily N-acetyltransferase
MEDAISAMRAFNRFYTRLIGVLDAGFLGFDLTLPEARLLFEIAHNPGGSARELQDALGLDAGYVSRLLKQMEQKDWIARGRSKDDARRRPVALTQAGRILFDQVDAAQRRAVQARLAALPEGRRTELAAAFGTARMLLGDRPAEPVVIRSWRTGDMGVIAARQSILYKEMHDWGVGLEIVEGEITTDFLRHLKPDREHCWVAELAGATVGSVFLCDDGDGVGRLRLLYVEPMARGRGIGEALVRTCIDHARACGYREMVLWTHTVLASARRIYAAHGFEITETSIHDEFGVEVQGETWRLDLSKA